MKTKIENELQYLLRRAASAQGEHRLELLKEVAALATSAEMPNATNLTSLTNLTSDQETTVRALQEATRWPEVRNNGLALANVARTIRRVRLGFS